MIDTHAHLDFPEFEKDREEVIQRFFENGGKAIINIGVDLEHSRKSIEIAEKHEGVFAAVGFHPEYFNEQGSVINEQKIFSDLKDLAKNKKVIAIGETGLDYFSHTGEPITDAQKENQKKGFIAQINLAKELGLSAIVHCREAWDDLYKIISEFSQSSAFRSKSDFSLPRRNVGEFLKVGLSFVLHCYSGEKKDTEKFLKLPNVYFSFSGNITYPKPAERAERLAEAVRMVPLDKIMLDSDAPFLAPQEMRGKRNEPIFVKYIAKKIAEIKGIGEKEVERKTDENAERFFSIGGN